MGFIVGLLLGIIVGLLLGIIVGFLIARAVEIVNDVADTADM